MQNKHGSDNLINSSYLEKEICVASNDISFIKDAPLQKNKLNHLQDSEEENCSICKDVDFIKVQSLSSQRSSSTPHTIPEIRITESSLPSSLSSSPQKLDLEIDPFPCVFIEERSNHLQVPSSTDEESDEDEMFIQESNTNKFQENKFNANERISTSLAEQSNKGVFMRSRSNTLDEIQEEDSSELEEDFDYGNESISDSASYDVEVHHNHGYDYHNI